MRIALQRWRKHSTRNGRHHIVQLKEVQTLDALNSSSVNKSPYQHIKGNNPKLPLVFFLMKTESE